MVRSDCLRWWSTDRPTSQPAAHLRSRARTSAGCDGAAQTVEGAFPLSACYQLLSRGKRRRRRSWCGVYLWPPPARTRSLARSAPIINGPSVRAGPLVRTLLHARPPARAAPRWRDFGCADVSGNPLVLAASPLLSVFRDPRRMEPQVALRFLCFTANHDGEDGAEDALTL